MKTDIFQGVHTTVVHTSNTASSRCVAFKPHGLEKALGGFPQNIMQYAYLEIDDGGREGRRQEKRVGSPTAPPERCKVSRQGKTWLRKLEASLPPEINKIRSYWRSRARSVIESRLKFKTAAVSELFRSRVEYEE